MLKITARKFIFIFALALALAPTVSFAEEGPGDENPAEVKKIIGNNPPIGKGKFKWLGFHIYDSKLWAKSDRWSYNDVFALNLRYARDISADDLVDNSLTEMRRIRNVDEAKLETYKPQLKRVFPEVKEGDTITAVNYPNGKVAFYHNGKPNGEVSTPGFARDFLSIWLDPNTKGKDLWQNVANKGGE